MKVTLTLYDPQSKLAFPVGRLLTSIKRMVRDKLLNVTLSPDGPILGRVVNFYIENPINPDKIEFEVELTSLQHEDLFENQPWVIAYGDGARDEFDMLYTFTLRGLYIGPAESKGRKK